MSQVIVAQFVVAAQNDAPYLSRLLDEIRANTGQQAPRSLDPAMPCRDELRAPAASARARSWGILTYEMMSGCLVAHVGCRGQVALYRLITSRSRGP